jgi:hypothetical protein
MSIGRVGWVGEGVGYRGQCWWQRGGDGSMETGTEKRNFGLKVDK